MNLNCQHRLTGYVGTNRSEALPGNAKPIWHLALERKWQLLAAISSDIYVGALTGIGQVITHLEAQLRVGRAQAPAE